MNKILLILILCLVGCGYGNLDNVKLKSNEIWQDQGFTVVAYEGYQMGAVVPFTKYGGAYVWYRLKRNPDNGILYSGYLQQWGEEIHVYGPKAIDAFNPNNL